MEFYKIHLGDSHLRFRVNYPVHSILAGDYDKVTDSQGTSDMDIIVKTLGTNFERIFRVKTRIFS